MKLFKTDQPIYIILLLILAGEAVFILPFVLARVFRPTVLEVFELTNVDLGWCFWVYGWVAFFSYLFGGRLADRFHPRKLMGWALIATALGGVVMATYPSLGVLQLIYGYWGFTTIFLFWAAMIKATRVWGGVQMQGRAFGFLDGGRGLVAASFGALGVLVFSLFISGDVESMAASERKEAFSYVILTSSAIVAFVGILVLLWLKPKQQGDAVDTSSSTFSVEKYKEALRIPSVPLLMIIILCAYVGYKLTDDFSLYAKEVMGYDEVDSAKVGTYLLYIRPIAGVLIGFLADRTRSSIWLIVGFATMLFGALLFASGLIAPTMHWVFLLSLLVTAMGVYAARTLYFAALQEGNIPLALTGTAVGVISFVGYTPDIFVGLVMGYLLDNNPGELGHQLVFLMMAIFAFLGCLTALRFHRVTTKGIKKKVENPA